MSQPTLCDEKGSTIRKSLLFLVFWSGKIMQAEMQDETQDGEVYGTGVI